MKANSKKIADALVAVQEETLRVVAESPARITPHTLEKTLIENYDLSQKQIKTVIRDLVADGELAYTYEFGTTFLEPSFNKPVRVSTHVVLKPPGHHYQPKVGDVVIDIKPGAAFGDGRHPTSRLAIRGIEYALKDFHSERPGKKTCALDIGVGSGVLVLTAVRMGIHKGLGIDIDPSARSEARENALLNRLGDQIEISDQYLETIDGQFDLVTANLRYPTLKKICPCLRKNVNPDGFIVFSGIRPHELADLIKTYARKKFELKWQDVAHDWVGVVFKNVA